ncbi:MAG: hypothetical protein RL762_69 [Bacteroidota bacterium]|jgi:hypothetical protein
MEQEKFYAQQPTIPLGLRQQLLKAPKIVNKQKKERSFWLLTACFFLLLNLGLYIQFEKQQEEATLASYDYLTPSYLYP